MIIYETAIIAIKGELFLFCLFYNCFESIIFSPTALIGAEINQLQLTFIPPISSLASFFHALSNADDDDKIDML